MLAAQGYTTANGMTASGDKAKAYKFSNSFDDQKYRVGDTGVAVTNQFEDCDLNYRIPGAGKPEIKNSPCTFLTS